MGGNVLAGGGRGRRVPIDSNPEAMKTTHPATGPYVGPHRMRNLVGLLSVIAVCLGVISPQSAFAQGRPDLVWMRGGRTAEVLGMCYSPDGTHHAAGNKDGVIRVWRVADWAEGTP